MRNSKKLLIGVLSVAALIGTGYAAWTIGGVFTDATQELNPIVEETIGTRDIALEVSKDPNDNIKFDSAADLNVTYNVKAVKAETNLIEDFDPYDLSHYNKVAEDYQPDLTVSARALDSTTGDPLDPSDEFFKIVNLPKEVTYEYDQWLAADYKDNGFPVELVFTWGDFTGGLNPQEYLDSQLASKTQEEQREFIQGVIDNLKGVKFEFTFKVEGAVIDTPEPVEDTTGEVTAPDVADSTFLIDGEAISGNLKAGEHQITITTADGKVVEDNKLIVVENGVDKEVTLTDSLTRAAHTYTATYTFLKDATYSFKYNVVDEVVVEEPTVFEKGKLGLWQGNQGKAYYFTGEMDGNFAASTEVFADAVDLTVYEHDNGQYTIQIDKNGKYLGAIVSGSFINFNVHDDEYFWDYDETYDTYITTLENKTVFMGTSNNYSTFSLSNYNVIEAEDRFIAHIDKAEIPAPKAESVTISANPTTIKVDETSELSYDLSPIGSQIDGDIVYKINGANDGVVSLEGNKVTGLKEGSVQIVGEIGGLTSAPITIEVNNEIEEPLVFEQGKLGFWQGNTGAAYYFNGEMVNKYYGGTTSDFDSAKDLTVLKTQDNKYIIKIDDTNQYIGAVKSGSHNNFAITDTEYFWNYNVEYDAYTTVLEDEEVYLGTYGTFNTISLSKMDTIEDNFVAHITDVEIAAPEATNITISANPTTIKVGGTTELNYKLSPTGSQIDGEIVYEVSGENDGVVSLEGSKVTGLKEGSVQIVGKIGTLISTPIKITVYTDDTPVGDSVVYKYDPYIPSGGISGSIYGSPIADPQKALEALNATSDKLTNNLINEVTSAEKIFTHSGQEASGIKFSTGSANGKLAFTTTAEVSKFAISYISWGSESTEVTVTATGEQKFTRARQDDDTNTNAVTLTCELSPSSTSFEISVSKRIVITKLEFWLA